MALTIVSGAVDERDAIRLRQLAQREDRTLSAEVRRAVREYVDAREQDAPPPEEEI